jgi:hypothetical protein
MWLTRPLRAWTLSVGTCIVLIAASVALTQTISGRRDHLLHNTLDVSIGVGLVFALIAALLYLPIFGVVAAGFRQQVTRMRAVGLGAALAPIAYLAVLWRFRESEDPQTLAAWVGYWARHPEITVGVLPFVVAGAIFGWIFSSTTTAHRAQS